MSEQVYLSDYLAVHGWRLAGHMWHKSGHGWLHAKQALRVERGEDAGTLSIQVAATWWRGLVLPDLE